MVIDIQQHKQSDCMGNMVNTNLCHLAYISGSVKLIAGVASADIIDAEATCVMCAAFCVGTAKP